MDIASLIRDMAFLGYNNFTGQFDPRQGYSVLFTNDDYTTNGCSLKFTKTNEESNVFYEVIISNKEKSINSGRLTINELWEMYALIMSTLSDDGDPDILEKN